MPAPNSDLHGSVPDCCATALILIDVINDLEFPGAEQILESAVAMAETLAAFKLRTKAAKIPVIYVNDNFGRWQSDFKKLVDHCLHDNVRGRPLVELLVPEENDYFVLKPKHSGFFSTTLELLLKYLQVQRLILTGLAGNMCVLYTANDAYMRDFQLYVPADCTVSNNPSDNDYALDHMQRFLKANITPSTALDLTALKKAD